MEGDYSPMTGAFYSKCFEQSIEKIRRCAGFAAEIKPDHYSTDNPVVCVYRSDAPALQ